MRAALARAVLVVWGALGASGLGACGNSERAGIEEARRQAEAEQQAKAAAAPPAKRLATPVRGEAHVPCAQLIDPAAFQAALKEKAPLAVKDVTKTEPEATASCALIRGGKRPTEAEQQAMIKRSGRLGVLPGDELCNVTAICSKIMDTDQLRASCKQHGDRDDESLGGYACVHIVAVGADDVQVLQLLDSDTRCILRVRGGPSNVDNEQIRACARTARDTIGPDQIRVDATAGASGSGSAG